MTKAEEAVERERKGFEDWWVESQREWDIPGVPLSAWVAIKEIAKKAYLVGRESIEKNR